MLHTCSGAWLSLIYGTVARWCREYTLEEVCAHSGSAHVYQASVTPRLFPEAHQMQVCSHSGLWRTCGTIRGSYSRCLHATRALQLAQWCIRFSRWANAQQLLVEICFGSNRSPLYILNGARCTSIA